MAYKLEIINDNDEITEETNEEVKAQETPETKGESLAAGDGTISQEPYLLRFFEYKHLPDFLQAVSQPFHSMAVFLTQLPDNPEKSTAFRKLLEAKDCAVRAMLDGMRRG